MSSLIKRLLTFFVKKHLRIWILKKKYIYLHCEKKNNEMEEDLYYVITDKIEKVLKTFGIEGDDAYECSGDIYREIKEYLKK